MAKIINAFVILAECAAWYTCSITLGCNDYIYVGGAVSFCSKYKYAITNVFLSGGKEPNIKILLHFCHRNSTLVIFILASTWIYLGTI